MPIEEWSLRTHQEFAYFILGAKLGNGMSREVYDHPDDPTKVIKVENSVNHFQNLKEWMIWQDFSHCSDISKWLAPCHSISESGTFLVMEKAIDLRPEEIPEKLPQFITDHKISNFGMIGTGRKKRVVCRDYGTAILTLSTGLRKW